ncbi:MAG: HAD family hydrolase [Polyangiales bacterium]
MIVLFDIDGTLLTFDDAPPGPGRTAMGRASRDLYGEDLTAGLRFAGGTDRAIARAMLDKAGVAFSEEAVTALLDRYVGHLEDQLSRRKYRPIGDVAGAVEACAKRGACVGLATGNTRKGAAIKLASAGLGDVFVLDRGGYGCDHELRPEVVRIAIERCGGDIEVVVVGDTEQDVSAARAVLARAVGVGHNAESRAELERAGADAIVSACGDALVDAIFSASK